MGTLKKRKREQTCSNISVAGSLTPVQVTIVAALDALLAGAEPGRLAGMLWAKAAMAVDEAAAALTRHLEGWRQARPESS